MGCAQSALTALAFPLPASRKARADNTLVAKDAFEADTRASSADAAALEATAIIVVTSTLLREVALDGCNRRRRRTASAGCWKSTSPVPTFTASVTLTSAALTLAVRATAAAKLLSVADDRKASARTFVRRVRIDTLARAAPTTELPPAAEPPSPRGAVATATASRSEPRAATGAWQSKALELPGAANAADWGHGNTRLAPAGQ